MAHMNVNQLVESVEKGVRLSHPYHKHYCYGGCPIIYHTHIELFFL